MPYSGSRIYLYFITSGSCVTMSEVPTAGSPLLFDPGDIYVYRGGMSLPVSRDGGATWRDILPNDMGSVNAIAQTLSSGSATISTTNETYIISPGIAKYQTSPETNGGWSSGSTPPTDLVPSCAAADMGGEVGILVGNIHSGTESRIVGAFTGEPFSLIDSDAGIPQSSGSMGLITCLEFCE